MSSSDSSDSSFFSSFFSSAESKYANVKITHHKASWLFLTSITKYIISGPDQSVLKLKFGLLQFSMREEGRNATI